MKKKWMPWFIGSVQADVTVGVKASFIFSVKNVLLCYKSNAQCLACVYPIRDAHG